MFSVPLAMGDRRTTLAAIPEGINFNEAEANAMLSNEFDSDAFDYSDSSSVEETEAVHNADNNSKISLISSFVFPCDSISFTTCTTCIFVCFTSSFLAFSRISSSSSRSLIFASVETQN